MLYLCLQGWYDIDSAKVINLLSATNKWQNTCGVHYLGIWYCQDGQFFCPVLQQFHHVWETHVIECAEVHINITQRCISWFRNHQYWTPIPCTNWIGLRTQTKWIGTWIWSEYTPWQWIYSTSEWTVVLQSSISHPYFRWMSGTWFHGRIYQCQPRDHGWILW